MRTPALLACILLWPAALAHGQVIYQTDFETADPITEGWHAAPGFAAPVWTTEQAFSGTRSIVGEGDFRSPYRMTYQQDQYYLASFQAFNGAGKSVLAHNGAMQPLRPGTGWVQNSYAFNFRDVTTYGVVFQGTGRLFIDDLQIRQVTALEAATSQDAAFAATMPAFNFTASPTRHGLMPRTIQKLAAGQAVKAVILGDSIANDTSKSFFEALVDRRYGTGRLNVRTVVANSAGASYWVQNNRIRDEAMVHNPDVVLFGGISSGADTASIREVFRQIRAANPNTEIVLMTPLAGDYNPYANPALAQPFDPQGNDIRAIYQRLAQQEGVEFVDMTTPWARYIQSSGMAYADFLRDPIHMNGRGMMVAGRILDGHFAPVPEPGALLLMSAAAGAGWLLRRRR